MGRTFEKIRYENLNARQKESYNFQKISGKLADYGFVTMRLSDDWNGADFLAQHLNGETLKVQLKGRLTVSKKYHEKDLWVCFRSDESWYLYPHDELLVHILAETNVANTESWSNEGNYTFPILTTQLITILAQYRLA